MPMEILLPHAVYIVFLFALGACVGSFLNVVVWRLPRDESLISPGSHCPRCNTPLAWYDNLPVIGWIKLHGKCRHCREPISIRYPIVEAVTGLLFVFYYIMFFILHHGPCAPVPQDVLEAADVIYVGGYLMLPALRQAPWRPALRRPAVVRPAAVW